jgi:hypothetical protein
VLPFGAANAGGDIVHQAEPDGHGGAYLSGSFHIESAADPSGYATIAAAVDASGALRWQRELPGNATLSLRPTGELRALVGHDANAALFDIDPASGVVLSTSFVSSGSLQAVAQNAGRFGALIAFNGAALVAGESVELPSYGFVTLAIEADGTPHLRGVFDASSLEVWHTRASVSKNGSLALVLAFAGTLDWGSGSYFSPPLSETPDGFQGPSVAVVTFDAAEAQGEPTRSSRQDRCAASE